MKIVSVVLKECDRRSLQEDLCKISDWSVKWEIPFNINKCQILQVGSRTIKKDCEMCGVKVEGVHSVKDLAVTVAPDLKCSQRCNESVKKANRMIGLIKKNFHSKMKMFYYLYIIVSSDLIWIMPCSFGLPTM